MQRWSFRRTPAPPGGRGRGRAAARRPGVRQRRRYRQRRGDRRGPVGDRGDRRLRPVRADAVRRRTGAWRPTPAAFFAASVVRRPAAGIVTVLGGGWIASGPADRSPAAPAWCCPRASRLLPTEGAGEVQTPLTGAGRGRAAGRRPGLVPPRQGRRAVRARRRAAPGPRRRDRAARCRPTAARRAGVPVTLGSRAMVFTTWRCRYSRMSVLASASTWPGRPRRLAPERQLDQRVARLDRDRQREIEPRPVGQPKWPTSSPASCSAMIVLLSRSSSSRLRSTTSPKCSVRKPGRRSGACRCTRRSPRRQRPTSGRTGRRRTGR